MKVADDGHFVGVLLVSACRKVEVTGFSFADSPLSGPSGGGENAARVLFPWPKRNSETLSS